MTRTLIALLALISAGCVSVGSTQAPPAPPQTASEWAFADSNAWTLTEPLRWEIGNSDVWIEVPAHFVHDKASVPRPLWIGLPRSADYTRAAVIHDYLYWSQRCTQEQADNLLVIAMKESNVGAIKRWLVYRGVRIGGGKAWESNRVQREAGMPRFNFQRPYGNETWPQVRARLMQAGWQDPPLDTRDDYCAYGDSQQVPGESD